MKRVNRPKDKNAGKGAHEDAFHFIKGTFELDNVKTGDTLLVYPNRKLVAYVPMSGIQPIYHTSREEFIALYE